MAMAQGEAAAAAAPADDEVFGAADADGGGDGGRGAGTPTTGGFGRSGDTRFSIAPLAWLGAGAGVVLLALFAARQALGLGAGFGIEDVLGWSDRASVAAAVQQWCRFALRWRTAAAYVLADSALFVPLYASGLIVGLLALRRALQRSPGLIAQALHVALPLLGLLCIGGLVGVDLVENFAGALRLGLPAWAALASLLTGLALLGWLWAWAAADPARREAWLCPGLAALAAALVLTLVLIGTVDGAGACRAAAAGTLPAGAAWAHAAKPALMGLAALPLALGAGAWWLGLDLALDDPAQRAEAHARAAWRAGVLGVVGRSRYVLAALALFAVFTLVMDQCRDVLLALAYPDPGAGPAALLWRKLVQGLCAVAVGMLAYSCWLWARLAGMVQRPGLVLPGAAGEPRAHDGSRGVAAAVGEFARGWARALALAPLAMVAGLVAVTVGDAVNTSLRAVHRGTVAGQLAETVIGLLGFGAFAIGFGLVLLQVRRRLALAQPADYYNSEPDFYRLLWGDSAVLARRPPPPDPRQQVFEPRLPPCERLAHRLAAPVAPWVKRLGAVLHPLAHPVLWPLLALLMMAGLRAAMAGWPDLTAQAPAALALLALALNWWLGVAGLLVLAEQRRAAPWGLLLLAAVGLLATLGWADNHRLPLTAPPWAALPALRWHGLAALGVLVLGAGLQWLLLTADRARFPRGRTRWSDARFNAARAAAALGLALAALAGLLAVDRASAPLLTPVVGAAPPAPALPRPPPGPPLAAWLAQLPSPPPADPTVLLVAAEGGGIRSAYWTAQVLARLHDADPAIDRRIAALSGVSGGAVGIAVYRACLAQVAPGEPVRGCVEAGFQRLDGLSPLVGGLLFEDALARVLPTTAAGVSPHLACRQPGCGHLSRALPFEREWMRQFPRLAEPLGAPFGPPLMLNATWVESGNRVVFSSLSPQALPASHDLVAELGVRPPLITAAHASARFPFVNPLAALPPALGASQAGGHLADGGYHDNSGTASLADLWRALQWQLPAPWRARLVLIRNGQPRIGCERAPRAGPPPACLDPTLRPSDAELLANLLRPADRRRLALWADLLGPAVALVNVSGIGAHGRQAPAALATELAAQPRAPQPPLFYDQLDTGDLVPLGWYLSPAARQAIEGQADFYFAAGRYRP